MKNATRILSILLTLLMVMSCFATMTFNAVAEDEEPEIVDPLEFTDVQKIVLGAHEGGPFPAHPAGQSFAVKTNVAADRRLASICAGDMATYNAACHEVLYEIFQWNTDYDTTVAGPVLWSYTEYDHADNATVTIPLDKNTAINGDILIVFTCIEAETGITPWQSNSSPEGTVFFDNGTECQAFTFVIETAAYVDVIGMQQDPTYVIDFGVFTKDAATEFGFQNPNGMEFSSQLDSGYITFTDLTGDPYVWIMGAKGLYDLPTKYVDYMVIKYRSFGGAAGEVFVQRADGVQPGQAGSHVAFNYTPDANWHTVVVDASNEWGNADTKLTIFRLDPVANAAGSQIDIAYVAFFSNQAAAEAYAAADTKIVHVKGELTEGNPAILPIFGINWGAETWFELKQEVIAVDPATADYTPFAGHVSTDTFKVNKNVFGTDGQAIAAIESVGNKATVDADLAFLGFRGWVGNNDKPVEKLGYALNDAEPVWSEEFFEATGQDVKNAGGENAQRFDVEIDTQAISNGTYNVYVLVKFAEDDTIYRMSQWPDFQIIVGDGQCYKVADGLTDAEGNTYSLNKQRVLNADGVDTGLIAWNCDDGRLVAASAVYPLTYQDPLAGAVEVDGRKYIYDEKIAVTPVIEIIDPEDNSVVSEFASKPGAYMSPDTLFINEVKVRDGAAHSYIANDLGGKIRDTDCTMSTFSLRGWAHTGCDTPLVEYGYSLNNGEIVWNSAWVVAPEPGLAGAAGGANTTRFKIDIDVTGLEEGMYNVYAFVKDEEGTEYRLAVWGDFKFVKGGTKNIVGYTDGKTTYALDAIYVEENGQRYVLTDAQDVTDGIPGGEEIVKGKYVYDQDVLTAYTPKAPVNPEKCQPVYILDGEGLNTLSPKDIEEAVYDYDKGCVRYTATNGDPNAGSNQIPAGTVVAPWMVVKYRTEVDCVGEIFLGTSQGAIGDSHVGYPSYIADGEWHYFVVNVGSSKNYDAETNVINHFRNDCVQGAGEWVEIEYYAFFDSEDKAIYYAENNMHELPQPPKTFTATFVADGEVVGTVEFKEGAKTLNAPKVPAKEGYTGKWEKYTLADADITINAVYTPKDVGGETEPETDAPTEPVTDAPTEPATDAPTEPATTPATDPAESETDADDKGCKSVVAASGVIALVAVLGVAFVAKKKKED